MLTSQIIDGTTKLVGLLGWPVAHSLSPRIHNHAFASLHLPFAYVPLAVSPRDLPDAIRSLRTLGFSGANVTIPHKQAAALLCDSLSGESQMTGTVNTLYFDNGKLRGTTTDADGFLRALAWMGHESKNGRVVILGNGGTARALGFALAHRRIAQSLTFIGRNYQKLSSLADDVLAATGFRAGSAISGSREAAAFLADSTLLVNCTPVGMHPAVGVSPLDSSLLHRGMTVFDTIYNPSVTRLIADARAAGCPCQNGMRMLLGQGLASFKYWTGIDAAESLFDIDELQKIIQG